MLVAGIDADEVDCNIVEGEERIVVLEAEIVDVGFGVALEDNFAVDNKGAGVTSVKIHLFVAGDKGSLACFVLVDFDVVACI